MKAQKRGFFNFIFSFLPGAAEMYMGFMKMGASLMLGFFGMIGIIGFLGLSDAFMMIPIVLYFYSFFHARNIATCRPEVFAGLQDDYFWNELLDGKEINIKSETAKKIGAWALIIAGVSMLWNLITDPIMDGLRAFADLTGMQFIYDAVDGFIYSLPRLVVAIVIIAVGVKLIRGKKKNLYIDEKSSYDMAYGMNTNGSTPFTEAEKNAPASFTAAGNNAPAPFTATENNAPTPFTATENNSAAPLTTTNINTPAPFVATDNNLEKGEKNA